MGGHIHLRMPLLALRSLSLRQVDCETYSVHLPHGLEGIWVHIATWHRRFLAISQSSVGLFSSTIKIPVESPCGMT
jgi:hypothetical protein